MLIASNCAHMVRNKNIIEEQEEEEEEADCEFRLLSDVDSLSEKVLHKYKILRFLCPAWRH